MLYHYLAVDEKGKVTEGEIDASSIEGLLQYLAGIKLRPISVKALGGDTRIITRLFGGITLSDKIFLVKYLALMLRVGTDLLSAINILITDFDKPAMRNFLLEVRDNIMKGRPFYEVFGRHPRVFSPVFINLIKAAETAGNLQETFENLATSLAQEAEMRNKIRAALIYPVLLLVFSIMIFLGVVVFALPKIAQVFTDSGIEPPWFSALVFGFGSFINNNLVTLAGFSVLFLSGSFYFFFKNDLGRRISDQTFRRLPILKRVYQDLAIQRFSSTLSDLTRAGVTIIPAMRITADAVGSRELRESILRVADEGLAKGLTIGEAFRKEAVLPRVVTNLIAISDKAGHLEEMLGTLGDFYRSNAEASIKAIVSIIEPVLLLFMGFIVGTVALSIIIPVYQLSTNVGA
ncbi:MAG: type II secretion system F family protein [Patescibacteria group bacterium]